MEWVGTALWWGPAVLAYGSQLRQTYQTVVWGGSIVASGYGVVRRVFYRRRETHDDDAWVIVGVPGNASPEGYRVTATPAGHADSGVLMT